MLASEVLLVTYYREIIGPLNSAILLAFTSFLIGLLGIAASFELSSSKELSVSRYKFLKYILSIIVISFFLYMNISILQPAFLMNPLSMTDNSKSDIIPLVMVMVERFLQGDFPYSEVSIWGYTLRPTYLPMIWLPFTLAELLDFDYRWIPFTILSLSLLLLQSYIVKYAQNLFYLLIATIAPWLVWYYIILDDTDLFTVSIENMNAAYYLLFGMALISRKYWWIAVTIALCLMARFSFVLWLPLMGIILLKQNHRRALTIIGISAGLLILIYIVPFLTKDPSMFMDSLSSYTVAAVGEWAPAWQAEGEKPHHLFRGIGLAGLFYEFGDGSLIERIELLKVWHYLTSMGCLIPMAILYFWKSKSIYTPYFLLASLKVYFVFFYSFIQVPYSYLMLVPIFISVLIFVAVWINPNQEKIA